MEFTTLTPNDMGPLISATILGLPPAAEVESPPPVRQRKIGKFLYLPVSSLEPIEPYLTLANEMAAEGFQVLLAPMETLAKGSFGYLPPGIIVFRSMTLQDARTMFGAEQNSGHLVAVVPAFSMEGHKWAQKLADKVLESFSATELVSLWRRNQYPMPFNIREAFKADNDDEPMPLFFDNYNDLAGRPIEQMGGSAWLVA